MPAQNAATIQPLLHMIQHVADWASSFPFSPHSPHTPPLKISNTLPSPTPLLPPLACTRVNDPSHYHQLQEWSLTCQRYMLEVVTKGYQHGTKETLRFVAGITTSAAIFRINQSTIGIGAANIIFLRLASGTGKL